MHLSWADLALSSGSDIVKILADLPGSWWDRIYRGAVSRGLIPDDPAGCRVLIAALIATGGILEQQFDDSPLQRFAREILGDARTELAKRILENSRTVPTATAPVPAIDSTVPWSTRIARTIDGITYHIAPWMGREGA